MCDPPQCQSKDPPLIGLFGWKFWAPFRYWLRFIASASKFKPGGAKPRVALVGTHRSAAKSLKKKLSVDQRMMLGQIKEGRGRWESVGVDKIVANLVKEFGPGDDGTKDEDDVLLHMLPRMVYIDSVSQYEMDLAEMATLRTWVGEEFANIRLRLVPKISLDVASLLKTARKMLQPIASFAAVYEALTTAAKGRVVLGSEDRFRAVLGHLSMAGHVMYFEDAGDVVVVDPRAFGKHVIGQVFCPHSSPGFASGLFDTKNQKDQVHFRKSKLVTVLGRVSTIAGVEFGDVDLVLTILEKLELCFQIPEPTAEGGDADVYSDAVLVGGDEGIDPLYAIPGRLSHGRPECWKPVETTSQGHHYLGVRLQVAESALIVPPSAFPQLQSRLHSLPGFAMWRNGLMTVERTDGRIAVAGLIELDSSLETIDVAVRTEMCNDVGWSKFIQVGDAPRLVWSL